PAPPARSSRPRSAPTAIPSSPASSASSTPAARWSVSTSEQPRSRRARGLMPLADDPAVPERPVSPAKEKFFYGGQAVIEGVMMRGPHHYAVAVRLPQTKEIVVDRGELRAGVYTQRFWKLPFVRGLALMAETLHLGMKSLIWSVNMNARSKDVEIGKRE